jgi:hypothetical protein
MPLCPGFPLRGSLAAYLVPTVRKPMGSRKFLPFLSIHVTPYNTGKFSRTSPNRFFCIGFRSTYNVAICVLVLTMLITASGICSSPVTYIVLCVRFACPLFTFATVVTVNNVPPETQHSILMAG